MRLSNHEPLSSVPRLLSLDLMSNGIGYVVFEGPSKLVDWGVKESKKSDPGRLHKQLNELVKLYRPQVLVLEDIVLSKARRSARNAALSTQIRAHAIGKGITVCLIAWTDVRQHFVRYGGYTKYEIARLVTATLPVLAFRLPPPRKPWKSEDSRMGIFDAAALGLTYYAQSDSDRAAIAKS